MGVKKKKDVVKEKRPDEGQMKLRTTDFFFLNLLKFNLVQIIA